MDVMIMINLSCREIGSWGPSDETCRLPLVIREKDTEYQFHRIILFDRLLKVKILKIY